MPGSQIPKPHVGFELLPALGKLRKAVIEFAGKFRSEKALDALKVLGA